MDPKKEEKGQVEKEGEQALSNAFREAAAEGSEATAKKPEAQPASEAKEPTGDEDKGTDTKTEIEKGKEEAQEPTGTDTQGKEKSEEAAHIKTLEEKRKRGEALTDDETKTLYSWLEKEPLDKRIHKHKTLEGMYNSETKRNKELQEEVDRLKAAAAKGSDPDKGKEADTSEAVTKKKEKGDGSFVSELLKDPAVKAFSEEYDEIAPGVFKVVEIVYQSSMEAIKKFTEAFSPIIETQEKTDREKHFASIEEKHPDFPKYRDSGELESWIGTLSPTKQKIYKKIYDDGTTSDVIEMVEDFRTAKGYNKPVVSEPTKPTEPATVVDSKKASAMEAVRSAKRPISVGAGTKKDDFSAAFAEASSKN